MKKQYLVMAQSEYQVEDKRWTNVKMYFAERPGAGRYYLTEEEARRDLERYIREHNKEYTYDSNGERIEKTSAGPFGVDLVMNKKLDDMSRVVAWKIKVREVTEWEEVETSSD